MGAEPPSSTPSISDIIPFGSISHVSVCKNRYHKLLGFHFRNKNVIRQTLCPNLHTNIHKNVYTVDSKEALSSKYH